MVFSAFPIPTKDVFETIPNRGWIDVSHPDYGAVGDGVTDDTAAIQAAIDAAVALKVATVFFPGEVYLCNGALQGTGTMSRLRFPAVDFDSEAWLSIELRGKATPPFTFGTVGSAPLSSSHTIIYSTESTGAIIGVEPDAFLSALLLKFTDIEIRGVDVPTQHGIDAREAFQLKCKNVIVGTDVYNVDAAQPTNSATGILTPKINNAALTELDNVLVAGYDFGIRVNEHTAGNNITVASCIRGLYFETANHASRFGRVGAYRCTHAIEVGGAHYFEIDQLNLEHPGAGQTTGTTAWQEVTSDIKDPSNVGLGRVKYQNILGGTGIDVSGFIMDGGANISVQPTGGMPVRCHRSHSSTQSIADATVQDITWNTLDSGSYTDIFTTSDSADVVCTLQGWYIVTVRAKFASNSTGRRGVYVKLNNSAVYSDERTAVNGADHPIVLTTPPFYVGAGGIINASAYQNSTGSLNLQAGAAIEVFKVA